MKRDVLIFFLWILIVPATYPQSTNATLEDAFKDLDYDGVKAALDTGISPNASFDHMSAIDLLFGNVVFKYYDLNSSQRADDRVIEAMDENVARILQLMFEKGAMIDTVRSLYIPISLDFKKTTEYLLIKGFDPNKTADSEYGTPMSTAMKYHRDDIVKLLLKFGAIEIVGNEKIQILFVEACRAGNIKDVKRLLKEGAKINDRNAEGRTGLMEAAEARRAEIVRILIAQGADSNIENETNFWRYPIVAVAYNCSSSFNETADWLPILELMIKKGAYVSVQDAVGNTALHWVCSNKDQNVHLAEMLLIAGIKVMQKNKKGQTPMDLAISGKLIKLLKSYGAIE